VEENLIEINYYYLLVLVQYVYYDARFREWKV